MTTIYNLDETTCLGHNEREVLLKLCASLFATTHVKLQTMRCGPAGPYRGTFRIHLNDRIIYASHRKRQETSELETMVLSSLSLARSLVPTFIASQDGWLFSESVAEINLAQQLVLSSVTEAAGILRAACESLKEVQDCGEALGLRVPRYQSGEAWAMQTWGNVERLASTIGLQPGSDSAEIKASVMTFLTREGRSFIKCDARPANAAQRSDGKVIWFDWEDCRQGWPIEDFVWLLCDESVPPGVDTPKLLHSFLPDSETQKWCPDPLEDYLPVLASCYVCHRMNLLLEGDPNLKMAWDDCINFDWPGSLKAWQRLADHGARWAGLSGLTMHLVPWFQKLRERN